MSVMVSYAICGCYADINICLAAGKRVGVLPGQARRDRVGGAEKMLMRSIAFAGRR